jgi:anti-anti-sigma factor
MEIVESKSGAVLIAAFQGRLDAHTSPAAQQKLLALIDRGELRLVADLAQLDYLSSAGLRIFMMAAKKISSGNGKIVLCSVTEPVKELFDIAGLTPFFSFYAAREEAVASFQ